MLPSRRSSWLGGSDSRLASRPVDSFALTQPSSYSATSNESQLSEDAIHVQVSSASLNEVTPNERVDCNSQEATDRASADGDRSTLHDFEVVEADDEAEKEEKNVETDEFGFISAKRKPIDVHVLRKREKKWLNMLENWRCHMDNKFLLGIPPALRGRAWLFLSGAAYQMGVSENKDVFAKCVADEGDQKFLDEIRKDLDRQLLSKEDLFKLLKAWTVLHPEEGYCQGQAPIASVLLMHMPLRDAFYCFVQICHKYLPGYYSAGLEAVQIDGDILAQLLKEKSRVSYRHLKKNNVEPVLYMIEWFMCIFCRTLPWPSVLRVWDMFFCEGVKVLFKVALVLFRHGLGTTEQCKQFPDLHSIVTRLRNLPPHILHEDFLVRKVCELDLDDALMEKIHYRAMKLRQMKVKSVN